MSPDPLRTPPHPLAGYFETIREWRANHYADWSPAQGSKTSAVLTLVRDEAVFFPIWLAYYSQYFNPCDIYVLDHETSDGSTSGSGFNLIRVKHPTFDNEWMGRVVADFHSELIAKYDVVLTTDADEIVAPHPEMGTLGQYIDRFDEEFVNCLGYEVLHMREKEAPYVPGQPVLSQRSHWFANDGYDKPVLTTQAMRWGPGFHGRADGRFNPDPDLRLIHLHRMDYEICKERHMLRSGMTWDTKDLKGEMGTHLLVNEGKEFEKWFYTDSATHGVDLVVEAIPEPWRGLV